MAWRDRQPDTRYHERWSQTAREADVQWDTDRRRRRSPCIPIWEHQERSRSSDRIPRGQDDRFDRPDRDRSDRDRYERDNRHRLDHRFDRRNERDYDRNRLDRNDDRNDRSQRTSRDRDRFEREDRFDREERFDRRHHERDERFNVDRERDDRRGDRRDERGASKQYYDSIDSDIPKAPSPPMLTEHEKEEMRSVAEMNRDNTGAGPGEASVPSVGDWYCVCGALNFKRRTRCYRRGCTSIRAEGTIFGGDPQEKTAEESKSAGITKRLLFRRLDTLTNEEKILDVLKQRVPKLVDTITGITIGKDNLTGTSRGLAYISFNSLSESTAAHTALLKLTPMLRIDNREVLISYCHDLPKHNSSLMQSVDYSMYYMPTDIDYTSSTALLSEADRINAAAAVAQSAINAVQARTMWMPSAAPTFIPSQQMMASVEPPDGKGLQTYSPPDTRTFMYDETSGYYYDASTGLYYDGTTQYFYNNKLNSYLYWDAANSTYYLATQATQNTEQPKLPSPPQATVQNTISKESDPALPPPPPEEKKKEKEDKVKVAKKIAKDMARWAKTLNQKKENARNGLVMEQILDTSASKGSADIGFSVLGASGPAFPAIVREISPIPPAEDFLMKRIEEVAPVDNDEGIIDWSKLTCLLCKRRFPSADVLTKHKNMSDLHKQNLVEFHKNNAQEQLNGYRDRAAERRMKYGEFDEPVKKIYQPPPPVVQAAQPPISVVDTIGGKMLQKMGWSEGKGLGKEEQGRTAPVEAEKRVTGAGLGQKRGIYTAAPGETYRDTVKKLMIARYKDLVGDEE